MKIDLKHWERQLVLDDGRTVLVRPIRPEDEALYAAFFAAETAEDLRFRFFGSVKQRDQSFFSRFTHVDHARAMAFIAVDAADGEMLGVARLHDDEANAGSAEFAIIVRSDRKSHGLGWQLMQLLVAYARAKGLRAVKGQVLHENKAMLDMCRELGFVIRSDPDAPYISLVELAINPAAANFGKSDDLQPPENRYINFLASPKGPTVSPCKIRLMMQASKSAQGSNTKAYLVGGGIASLAAAAYLIRDGGIAGSDISIFETRPVLGGSLDGAGSADRGYVIRGGRMFTYEAYTCTFDLLSFIPSLIDPAKSIKDEILEFNDKVLSHSCARLVRNGEKVDVSIMGFSNRDRLDLMEIMAISEARLGAKRIRDVFQPSFFKTNFWFMWATTFAFQPWHSAVEMKRYLHRFIQEFPRLNTLAGVRRTPYNQYDSLVLPLQKWLAVRGVQFEAGAEVTDLDFRYGPGAKSVEQLRYFRDGAPHEIAVRNDDLVFVTIGSMTAGSSLGSMRQPAKAHQGLQDGSWALWEKLAKKDSEFGRPSAFDGNIDESKWLSFTATMHDPTFFRLMEEFTGNAAGTGGLVTFVDSNWLMSVVLPHQPHFIGQPEGTYVFWGYGLFVDQEGNYVKKKMSGCCGEELLTELLGHLRFDAHKPLILKSSNCIPCMMPFITSQFMPRVKGDRPQVRPAGTTNLAFIGQYCEIPDDVVFTVEYSVRSAQMAVYSLLDVDKKVSPLYKAQHDLGVLFGSLKTLLH